MIGLVLGFCAVMICGLDRCWFTDPALNTRTRKGVRMSERTLFDNPLTVKPVATEAEEWRPVLGYEGWYSVSNTGRVRRDKAVGHGCKPGRILRHKQPTRSCCYMRVTLCKKYTKRTHAVHVLVAESFLGKRPRGKFVNHKNLKKLDNSAANLEWVTRKQNARHAIAAGNTGGRPLPGIQNGRAKLSEAQVREIKIQKGVIGQRVLAALCGVSKSAIQFIHQGKHWIAEWPEELRVREIPEVVA